MPKFELLSDSAEATEKYAQQLASLCIGQTLTIYLSGELGAGKTTFSRGFLRGLGYEGNVKSPTYTVVEPYEINGARLYHFDFYRLSSFEELETIGIRDYFSEEAICLVEWPERAQGGALAADICIDLSYSDGADGQDGSHSRKLTCKACSSRGEVVVEGFFERVS